MATVQIKDRDGKNLPYTGTKVQISNGDGTYTIFSEGNAQETKEVQIIENGTTEIIPDVGYNFLKKVDLTINVPSSGNSIDFGINVGDIIDTLYINTTHDTSLLDTMLTSLEYPYTETMQGVPLKYNIFLEGKIGNLKTRLFVGDLSEIQQNTYFIYAMDYSQGLPIVLYATEEFDATAIIGSVIPKGWGASIFSTGGQQVTISYLIPPFIEIKDNYFSKSPQIYGDVPSKGLKLTQTNTTYQSEESKEILRTVIEKAKTDGVAQFSLPGWPIGLAFMVNNQTVFAINSFYAISGESITHFYIKGGINTGEVEVGMKLSGVLDNSTNEITYNLDLLEVDGTDVSSYITSTSAMSIVVLE